MRGVTLSIKLIIILVIVAFAVPAFAQQAMSRMECQGKANATKENLDKWIQEYTREMNASEPVQKAKYEEWIRELKKLKSMVEEAESKLDDSGECSSSDCVADQCNLVIIADQQVGQLIKETEEQLGSAVQFQSGSGTEKEVNKDEDTIGDDTMLVYNTDTGDALQPTEGERAESSDQTPSITDPPNTDPTAPDGGAVAPGVDSSPSAPDNVDSQPNYVCPSCP